MMTCIIKYGDKGTSVGVVSESLHIFYIKQTLS